MKKPKDNLRKYKNEIRSGRIFSAASNGIVVLFSIFCFVPFWLVVINSFASEASIASYGFILWPKEFSLSAYEFVFRGGQVYNSYRNTILVLVIGTPMATLITAMYAYVLAHPRMKYRKQLSFLTYFTMIMGTAIVGYYMLIATWLGIKNSLWALILPLLFNPFYAFIMVAAYRETPYEISEAACIDGANDIIIFFRIILPITKPTLATVGLFYGLRYWNDWWNALLFIDNYKLHPLQMMIRSLISSISAASYVGGESGTGMVVPTNSVKMAVVCLTVGPIIFLYPFVQKYFVKGVTVGAVKG